MATSRGPASEKTGRFDAAAASTRRSCSCATESSSSGRGARPWRMHHSRSTSSTATPPKCAARSRASCVLPVLSAPTTETIMGGTWIPACAGTRVFRGASLRDLHVDFVGLHHAQLGPGLLLDDVQPLVQV